MALYTVRGRHRKKTRFSFIMMLCLFLSLSFPTAGAGAVDSPTLPILLVNGAIYPQQYDPGGLPAAFRADDPPSSTPALYLLQCPGPVKESWLEEVGARRGEPRGYVAYNTLLVAMDGDAYSRVRGLGFVSWSGLYQPYYKVSPALQLRLVQGGESVVLAQLFDAGLLETTLEALRGISVEVLGWGGDDWCGVIALRLPMDKLKEVAALPAVEWLDLCTAGTLPADPAPVGGSWTVPGKPGTSRATTTVSVETVGVADTGLVSGDGGSPPFPLKGRLGGLVSFRGDHGADPNGHGTAVAGVLLAGDNLSEPAPEIKPLTIMAYATGYGLSVPPLPISLISMMDDAYRKGVGVFLNGSVPEGRESLGRYGIYAFQRDAYAWTHPDMVIVEAAGNEGTDADGDGRVDAGSLLGGATAKNVISVGGCENPLASGTDPPRYKRLDEKFPGRFSASPLGEDPSAGNPLGMAAFSSRGPTTDGRIKPDLVAPATWIPVTAQGDPEKMTGLFRVEGDAVARAYGTSLAAALLAGEAAVMRAALRSIGGGEPSAALVKAFLINGAMDMFPGQYGEEKLEVPRAPNPVEGWGRLDLAWFKDRNSWIKFVDDREGLRNGDSRVFRVELRSGKELRVTLAWTDYPSLPECRLHLVNDLDLRVIGPAGEFYYPNGRSSRDPLNNTERIIIDVSGRPGKYAVEIKAWNVPFAPQPYALVIQAR